MKSQIQENIISNEKLIHNSTISAKKLYDIAKHMEIKTQTFATLFQLKSGAICKINKQNGKVKIKLYTQLELQNIEKQIKNEFKNIENINYDILKNIQKKYKIGNKEIRILFNISSNQLIKLKKNKNYQVPNIIKENFMLDELLNNYKYKAYITPQDIKEIKNKYELTTKQIAKFFHLTIETITNLEKNRITKSRIYLYTSKDVQLILNQCQQIIQKQTCTLYQLNQIFKKLPYDKKIILEVLGINTNQYNKLKNNLTKSTGVYNYELKQKVSLCLLDIYTLYGYGKKEYKLIDLENILQKYNLTIENFIEYSDKTDKIRKMYKDSLLNNKKIQMNPKTRMTNEFFEDNYEMIKKKVSQKVSKFCSIYGCHQEEDDYLQNSYELLLREGGYIVENMIHNTEDAVNLLSSSLKTNLLKQYYQRPHELRIDVNYNGKDIDQEQNKNYWDIRFSPEEVLEKKYEINEFHKIIIQNLRNNINFAEDFSEDFFDILAFNLDIDEKNMLDLKKEIGIIILQNNLARLYKKGRIIQMNG